MTAKEANQIRKGLVGFAAYKAWRDYMDSKNDNDCSAENFEIWDVEKNYGALRASLGSDEYLISLGVRQRFNAIMTLYHSHYIKAGKSGTPISIRGHRKGSDGKMWPVENMDDAQVDYQIARLKMDMKNTANRLHSFQHDWDVVRETMSGWLFEFEEELVAAD